MATSLCLLLVSFTCLLFTPIYSLQFPKHYVIYMGGLSLDDDDTNLQHNEANGHTTESSYLQLLASVIPREENDRVKVVHHYKHAFKGFSAMLTDDEAAFFSEHDEVVSIFPDPTLQLHTTRSWDFLESISGPISNSPMHGSSDVIVGVIDTGIWPESSSFNDEGMGEIPSRWKGICMEGPNFTKSNCNRKLIGARSYVVTPTRQDTESGADASARDSVGHGTHTASIAAGARVADASYCGLARGTARGGDVSSRVAVYKTCTEDGCSGAAILKAMDDAVNDGVDFISISIGLGSSLQPDFLVDPIAIGAFHAELRGILVICSAGNEGPTPFTVVNAAPWIFTVSASDIDRKFQSTVVLGNGKALRGSGINFSNLTGSEMYPLVYGKDAAGPFVPIQEAKACYPGSLDRKKSMGKIVICVGNGMGVSRRIQKLVVEDAEGKGMVLINEDEKTVPFDSEEFPFSEVSNGEGYKILKYMSQTKNPKATILPTVEIQRAKPAPVVAYFSSRGPGVLTDNILKPDVMAPGVAILGAAIPKGGREASAFAVRSGTSMACPHVTGASAFLKSLHPSWPPSFIKSALITSATSYDNMRRPLSNTSELIELKVTKLQAIICSEVFYLSFGLIFYQCFPFCESCKRFIL
ncbi:PREDICTED: CO(2)-response secreted protease isoform X3 [Tarenaya hassleriana]|uniref:CO(2)-response secreted protease isoform X3 n=1 Tax=Tarenaya hassleriana TaxID=28532 RepID=UPI0008FD6CE2|nr:PREDICTED: CO(2)-response secreted protease isoform X3 [Tarenaya hassleriana]